MKQYGVVGFPRDKVRVVLCGNLNAVPIMYPDACWNPNWQMVLVYRTESCDFIIPSLDLQCNLSCQSSQRHVIDSFLEVAERSSFYSAHYVYKNKCSAEFVRQRGKICS